MFATLWFFLPRNSIRCFSWLWILNHLWAQSSGNNWNGCKVVCKTSTFLAILLMNFSRCEVYIISPRSLMELIFSCSLWCMILLISYPSVFQVLPVFISSYHVTNRILKFKFSFKELLPIKHKGNTYLECHFLLFPANEKISLEVIQNMYLYLFVSIVITIKHHIFQVI